MNGNTPKVTLLTDAIAWGDIAPHAQKSLEALIIEIVQDTILNGDWSPGTPIRGVIPVLPGVAEVPILIHLDRDELGRYRITCVCEM